MPKSSSLFLFPDVNVWLALSCERHVHYQSARDWFEALDEHARLCFCRFSQISLFRLLTTEAVMGAEEVLTQAQAWRVYDRWMEDERIVFLEESSSLEAPFRALSQQKQSAPKDWADSYLSAFAMTAGLHLVTFDRSLHSRIPSAILLS